jgi:hypothetical protein
VARVRLNITITRHDGRLAAVSVLLTPDGATIDHPGNFDVFVPGELLATLPRWLRREPDYAALAVGWNERGCAGLVVQPRVQRWLCTPGNVQPYSLHVIHEAGGRVSSDSPPVLNRPQAGSEASEHVEVRQT